MPKKRATPIDRTFPKASATTRYVCVHGHFYQPPRENPWLETVELQESAAPYHDWNERITSECYAPNGASRITNKADEIIRIMNNYARMSFNFGPTLLSWLEEKAPRTYRMILDADATSADRYSGHGSAVAQVYNHIIMPLANERDARTQIRWGMVDFEQRFGRKPEGMWLAETAVNTQVLELLAEEGIAFTILAPHQCRHVRRTVEAAVAAGVAGEMAGGGVAGRMAAGEERDGTPWTETPNASVDTTRPYRVPLPNGKSIVVFFYDGPTSRAIAFEALLNRGETFAQRLLGALPEQPAEGEPAMLSHVATDGESYGHHHKHGEMALSYAMHWIEEGERAQLTNYGEYLERFPPRWEAEIVDDTSWSCAHGVERWRSDCGCNGGKVGWNQQWRGPLRRALDLLRDRTAPLAERRAEGLLKDLWAARDAYVRVILDRSTPSEDRFLAVHATHELTQEERTTVWELMELERHAQLMYTSCGWFFDEISGIETVQIIAYAGRVLQLAKRLFGAAGEQLEPEFLTLLAEARSNLPEVRDGAEVYRRFASSKRLGLEQVGAHYAISSIFRNYPEEGELFCYTVTRTEHELLASGRGKLAIGRAQLNSRITEECEEIAYAVLHLGDQNLSAAVKRCDSEDAEQLKTFHTFSEEVGQAIRRANLPEVIRLIDRYFGETAYSLTSLFTDEQHRILRTILDQTLSEMEDSLHKIYEDHASLLHFLTESGMAAPPALALAAGYALNANLRRALEAEEFDGPQVLGLLELAMADQVALDTAQLSYVAGLRMKKAMTQLEGAAAAEISPEPAIGSALSIAECLREMPFEVNLWQAQNIWNDLLQRGELDTWKEEWREGFRRLGRALHIALEEMVVEEGVSVL